MTEENGQFRTIRIGDDQSIIVHQIDSCAIPVSNMTVLGNIPEKKNAVYLNPTGGMSLISVPHDLIETFDGMKMLNHSLNTFTNFGIKEIRLGDRSIWITYNSRVDKDLRNPNINLVHIQQTIIVNDFRMINVICQGPCLITGPEYTPFTTFDMDCIMRSVRFHKEADLCPTFCLDLHVLYDCMNNNTENNE